jgi:DNA-directed RNA polymerase subunit RPC12/RpoP
MYCTKCNRRFDLLKTGVFVHKGGAEFLAGDLYECSGCNSRIVANLGAESFKSDKLVSNDPHGLVVVDLEAA